MAGSQREILAMLMSGLRRLPGAARASTTSAAPAPCSASEFALPAVSRGRGASGRLCRLRWCHRGHGDRSGDRVARGYGDRLSMVGDAQRFTRVQGVGRGCRCDLHAEAASAHRDGEREPGQCVG